MDHRLSPHPDTPAPAIDVTASIRPGDGGHMLFAWIVSGTIADVRWPGGCGRLPSRTDGLWRTTCFEVFARHADGRYREFNFASNGDWAAYDFSAYRDAMKPADVVGPLLARSRREQAGRAVAVAIDTRDLAGATHLNLAAVIEATDGTKSYWALAHPPGAPDFHHPDCFVLELPATG